jgi:hypothetical protein
MDQDAHDLFIKERDEISLKNKANKENRIANMEKPHDELDERNQKRLLLVQYDLPKHRKFLKIIKSIAYTKGWFK